MMRGRDEWPIQFRAEKPYDLAGAQGYRAGTLIRVEAGLHWLGGNPRPYWSVTGCIGTAHQLQTGNWEAGGCIHDDIARHWPELAPVIALHLSDDRGVPMHAEANAVYHAGRSRRFAEPGYYDGNADHLRSHLRITADEAAAVMALPTRAAIEAYVRDQFERYAAESAAAVQLLRSLGATVDPAHAAVLS